MHYLEAGAVSASGNGQVFVPFVELKIPPVCDVLTASVGFVESIIGFTPEQISVLMACYLALDGYGPAANVTGDGAIALICQRLFGESARAKP